MKIAGSVPGTAPDSTSSASGRIITFDPKMQSQRAGLALVNGVVLIAWAGHEDLPPYHGWIMAFDAASLARVGIMSVSPDAYGGGVWQGGRAPTIDASGYAYFATGNGNGTAAGNFGNSLLKLHADRTGIALVDYFTPGNEADLSPQDYDLSGSGFTLLPGTNLVSGSVSPPPEIYARTFSHVEAPDVVTHGKPYGPERDYAYHSAFTISVPEGYQAVSGYIQKVNSDYAVNQPRGASLEMVIADHDRVRLMSPENPHIGASFAMSGETGDVPVTVRTFYPIASLAYAMGLVCNRTDSAYAQWQLRTHAAIVAGYHASWPNYEDKLARYVAAVRAQLAGAGHWPTTRPADPRKSSNGALYLPAAGRTPGGLASTPVPAPLPPSSALPDPVAVRTWGAMVAFFERAFEWENLMFTFYPYYWGRPGRWEEMVLTQDLDPQFEAFLKAGAARVVVPAAPGFEAALAHYQETGDVWMGEEIPDMYGDNYLRSSPRSRPRTTLPARRCASSSGRSPCPPRW